MRKNKASRIKRSKEFKTLGGRYKESQRKYNKRRSLAIREQKGWASRRGSFKGGKFIGGEKGDLGRKSVNARGNAGKLPHVFQAPGTRIARRKMSMQKDVPESQKKRKGN